MDRRKNPEHLIEPRSAACALPPSIAGHLGRLDEARRALDEIQRRQPEITIGFVQDHTTFTYSDYMDHFMDGLRKAGLPG